jgi:hypothetical protein
LTNNINKKEENHKEARILKKVGKILPLLSRNQSRKFCPVQGPDYIASRNRSRQQVDNISKRQICSMFVLMGTAFSDINAVQINNLQKSIDITNDKLATLAHINQIKEDHLEHLEIENSNQDAILFNSLRYNPAILATAAHQVVLQTADIIHKVKFTLQQVQNNRLSTELLRGETVNKIFNIIKKSASAKGLT